MILLRAFILIFVVRPFTRWFIGYNGKGLENIKDLKQMVLVSNHNSHLDTLVILSNLSIRQALHIRPVAAEDYFGPSHGRGKLACVLFNLVLISRKRISKKDNPLDQMAKVLRGGDSLLIFPEGTRGETAQIKNFKPGVAHVSKKFPEIPIIPAGISGTHKSLPKGSYIPLPVWVDVAFGSPISCHGSIDEIMNEIETSIRYLIEEMKPKTKVDFPLTSQKKSFEIASVGIDGSGKSTCYSYLLTELGKEETSYGVGDKISVVDHGKLEELDWVPGAGLKNIFHRAAKAANRMTGYKLLKLIDLKIRQEIQDIIILKFRPRHVISDGHPLINILAWGLWSTKQPLAGSPYEEAIHVLIGERTLTLNRIFYFARKFPIVLFLKWFSRLRLPDHVFFLTVSPENAIDRIVKRGEKRQIHETADKLKSLQKAYFDILDFLKDQFNLGISMINTDNKTLDGITGEVVKNAKNLNPEGINDEQKS